MLFKDEIKTNSAIYHHHTQADSVIALSNISDLLKFDRGAYFLERQQSKSISNVRRSQLAASDTLLEQLLPNAKLLRTDGKPYLESAEANISISHTGQNLGMILGREKVALDMEPVRRSVQSIEHKFLNHRDVEVSQKAFPENPSLLVWCVKECLFKFTNAKGVDFSDHLQLTDIESEDCVRCSISHPMSKEYLRVHFTVINQLLIAYIG